MIPAAVPAVGKCGMGISTSPSAWLLSTDTVAPPDMVRPRDRAVPKDRLGPGSRVTDKAAFGGLSVNLTVITK